MEQLVRQNKGYILVELLVSVVILSGGILFLIDSMRTSFQAAQRTQATQQALGIARETFHNLMTDPSGLGKPRKGEKQVGDIVYRWEVNETYPLSIENITSDIWLVTLKVSWHDDKEYAMELPLLWRHE